MLQIIKNKWLWVVVALVVVIIISILLGNKIKGWLQNQYNSIPGDSKTGESKPLTYEEKAKAIDLAQRIKKDIEALTGAIWRDSSAYYEIEKATDRVFVATANKYKELTGRSMISDIQGETTFNPWLVDSTKKIIERAKNLNII